MRITSISCLAALGLSIAAGTACAADANDILPKGPGKPLIVRACVACHAAPQIVAKRRTADDWDVIIGKMVDRGAILSADEQDAVYDYLVTNFAAN